MEKQTEEFLDQLGKEIDFNFKQYRRFSILQWCIMIPVVIAGVLTTAAGISGNHELWIASSPALLIWGLITAVGSSVNQTGNPKQKGEFCLKIKMAMKGIRNAIIYQGLPLAEAARIQTLARSDPETVIEELAGRKV